MQALWAALHEGGVDVAVTGHDHDYERFAPMDAEGDLDEATGIRQFVVGTGGRSLRPFRDPIANSEVREFRTYGVLKLTLPSGSYHWEFVPQIGSTWNDVGTGVCH